MKKFKIYNILQLYIKSLWWYVLLSSIISNLVLLERLDAFYLLSFHSVVIVIPLLLPPMVPVPSAEAPAQNTNEEEVPPVPSENLVQQVNLLVVSLAQAPHLLGVLSGPDGALELTDSIQYHKGVLTLLAPLLIVACDAVTLLAGLTDALVHPGQ